MITHIKTITTIIPQTKTTRLKILRKSWWKIQSCYLTSVDRSLSTKSTKSSSRKFKSFNLNTNTSKMSLKTACALGTPISSLLKTIHSSPCRTTKHSTLGLTSRSHCISATRKARYLDFSLTLQFWTLMV